MMDQKALISLAPSLAYYLAYYRVEHSLGLADFWLLFVSPYRLEC